MDESAWRDAATRDLRGRPVERLAWKPEPDVALGPVCASDVPSSRGQAQRGWQLVRAVSGDAERVADAIRVELDGGAEVLRLHLSGLRGARELATALRPLDLREQPIELADDAGPGAAAALIALWRGLGLPDAAPRIDFGLDPLGELGQVGALVGSPEQALRAAADVGRWCAANAPRSRAFCVDATRWHAAGGDHAWCVALAVAGGLAAVREMEALGVPVADAFAQVAVRLSVDSRFLLSAASLRAARRVWARVAELAGVDAALALGAVPAHRERTRYDAPVNALRQTSATFAAIVGGAGRIEAPDLAGPDGGRAARNLQLVLRDESHLGAVADPGGGSWAIESLTDQVARAAWARLQQVEAAGGMLAALKSGQIASVIRASRNALREKVRTRERPVLGVTRFPNAEEPTPPPILLAEAPTAVPGGLDPVADFDALIELGLKHPISALGAAISGEGLARCPASPPIRMAEAFEALRDRPTAPAWIATVGPLAEHGARTAFGVELLASGGVPALERPGADGFDASGCRLALVSAVDARFGEAADVVAALTAAGAAVWVLGQPGEHEPALRDAGARGFLFRGIDTFTALNALRTEASR